MTPTIACTPNQYDIFIGVDVDKKSFAFTVKDQTHMLRTKKIPSEPESLYNYIRKNHPDKKVLCAYEAGPTGFGLYDYMSEKEISCLVVSPSAIPTPPNERVKTNKLDSKKIATHLKAGHLTSIRVPQGCYRELRHLVKIREDYAQSQRAAKQRIKSLLLYESLHKHMQDDSCHWSNKYIQQLYTIPSSPAVRQRLDMIIKDLTYARTQLAAAHKTLRTFYKAQEALQAYLEYLQSIPGIGFITAVSILGKIGDPRALRNQRELAAFAGLVPVEYSTGDTISRGSVTKLGDKALRSLLVEAAWTAIRYDKNLRQFYDRIRSRNHPRIASKKAIVAVARKMTHIIYRVLKDERKYIRF